MINDLAKKIIDFLINQSAASLDKNHKFLKLKRALNVDQLTPDFDSLYTHALMQYSIEATDISIHLFTLDAVKSAFHAYVYENKDHSTIAEELHKQFQLLKAEDKKGNMAYLEEVYSSSMDFQSETDKFNDWFRYFQNRSSTPFELDQYRLLTRVMEKDQRIKEENLLKSFDFQVGRYLRDLRDDFHKDFPGDLYIDLNGETRILEDGEPPHYSDNDLIGEEYKAGNKNEEGIVIPHKPLDSLVYEWLKEREQNLLVIIGEYGTGKTTFSRHMAHKLAEYFIESKDRNNSGQPENAPPKVTDCDEIRIPLYFPLKDFEITFDSFIVNQFSKAGVSDIDYIGFLQKMEKREFVLILDGFDEMTQKIDAAEKKNNFEKIRQVLAKCPNCKIILTTREEYFQSTDDFHAVFDEEKNKNYRFVYLRPFNDYQIRRFLKAYTRDPEFYWDQINAIFDLHDLAQRPVLLQLIVEHFPGLIEQMRKQKAINASDLYERCIFDELSRKSKELKFIVPGKYRLQILRNIAVWMFLNDSLSIDLLLLNRDFNLEKFFNTKTPWEFEKYLNEFLTFTFLLREGDNQYRISHKSFRDYLTAQAFVDEINSGKIENFGRSRTTHEINDFIMEQISNKDKLLELVINARGLPKERQWQGTNSANLLLRLDARVFKKQDLSRCHLSHVDFSRCNLTDTDFSGADLSHCTFTKSILSARLTNANLEHSLLNLAFSGITDLNSIFSLNELKQVKKLVLIGNHIPKSQIKALKKALPHCIIE